MRFTRDDRAQGNLCICTIPETPPLETPGGLPDAAETLPHFHARASGTRAE